MLISRGNRRSSPAGIIGRFAASVAVVSGLLLIIEAAVTFAWQEPVSAFLAARSQAGLEDQFEESRRELRAEPEDSARVRPSRPPVSKLAARQADSAKVGKALGRIKIPEIGISFTFVHGTDADSLRKGPGHYVQTDLPGGGGTVGLAGHRTTYLAPFREIDQLDPGDAIKAEMAYGKFKYEVEKTRIVDPSQIGVLRDVDEERLVLTACNPLYSAKERIVVFARLEEQKDA